MKRKNEEELEARIDLFRKRLKDADDIKVRDDVFDTRTLMNLYYLSKKGYVEALGGSISRGKEANIFYALGRGGKQLALKIYRVAASDFKAMQDYIIGDPRFRSVKGNKRSLVNAWTRKEYRNLLRAEEAGVRVPHPYTARENILVMDLVGVDGTAAPLLREVDLDKEEAERVYRKIMDYIVQLYKNAGLVHADLSEFNILYDGEPVLIDMGQAVTLDHPNAMEFLKRDISNLVRYFRERYGIGSEDEIWSRIASEEKDKDMHGDRGS